MTNERRVLVHRDVETLTGSVAARFITKVVDLLEEQETVPVCLTGGTMGEAVLAAIARSQARDSVDWSRLEFWWGDERYLPKGDPERNETQSRRALLDHVPVDPARIHAFPAVGEHPDIETAAAAYAAELEAYAAEGERHPRFEITFLGAGNDGHIASLFPDHPTVAETERTVVWELNSPKPPPLRLSLTMPVINASQRIWTVLAGPDKAGALGLALADASVTSVPLAGVLGRKRTVFFVDEEAAAQVPDALIQRDQYWTSSDDQQR